jgi:ABC-type enterochelin transport system permease subunit
MKTLIIIVLIVIMAILSLSLFDVITNKIILGASYIGLAALIIHLHLKKSKQ